MINLLLNIKEDKYGCVGVSIEHDTKLSTFQELESLKIIKRVLKLTEGKCYEKLIHDLKLLETLNSML